MSEDGNPPQQEHRRIMLRVPTLDIMPNAPSCRKVFSHWERQLKAYVTAAVSIQANVDKLAVLCGFVSAEVHSLVEEIDAYDEALKHLQELYQPTKNVVFARHLLSTRAQCQGESIQEFYQSLLSLTKDCVFKQVSAEEHKQEAVRDAFIRGLRSSHIRTRLLEQEELPLGRALVTALSLEKAEECSISYYPREGAHVAGIHNPIKSAESTCSNCEVCAQLKPRFCKAFPSNELIKAVLPWQRISIDFKGPVKGKHKFILIVVDEYSRFPFAFPCSNMTSDTVITCLKELFTLVGLPEFVHSDRSMSFLSKSVKEFLTKKGVATSKTTPYHPTGNSQCERVNQTVWRTVKLLLAQRHLHESQWEAVLSDALHCIRSLLCTATNCTPHDRFFSFQRRSMVGLSIPDWLFEPGTVLLRRFVRDKSEPLCDKVELIEANSKYALIRHSSGTESTVSITDLAPYPNLSTEDSSSQRPVNEIGNVIPTTPTKMPENGIQSPIKSPTTEIQESSKPKEKLTDCSSSEHGGEAPKTPPPLLRRSTRNRNIPERYGDYVTH